MKQFATVVLSMIVFVVAGCNSVQKRFVEPSGTTMITPGDPQD